MPAYCPDITTCSGNPLVVGIRAINVSLAPRMVREGLSGQVFVTIHGAPVVVELPLGGFKRSGFDRVKGDEGLRNFGQIKTGVIGL